VNILLISTLLSALAGQLHYDAPPPPPPPPAVEEEKYEVLKSYKGEVTAYTSREEETDETPFTSASGETVYWGMIATNAYPFGTHVRFPDLYGDKVFEVKDRMHSRYKRRMDIWFPELGRADDFGLRTTKIEIVREIPKTELAKK
jgi:3D (Asp-Asp-Asp) domain-containing protein